MDKVQLKTVYEVMRTLNYYQILKVGELASDDEIQDAFHREALAFHPDQFFSENDPELQELAKKVYGKVVEAYNVLSTRTKRIAYDNKLKGIDRIEEDDDMDEDAITSVKRKPDWATSGPGEKFFKLAEKAFAAGDVRSAQMNVQIALGAEPSNPKYMKLKERIAALSSKS